MIKEFAKKLRYCILYIKYFHKFKSVGSHTVMGKPLRIAGGANIEIGDFTYILDGLRIEAIEKYGDQTFTPHISIGDRVEIGQNCHISCSNSVIIEDDVTFAPGVMVNDSTHGHDRNDVSIERQPLKNAPIVIKKGCLIGYNAVILPGVTVGEYSFVGAGCIVAKDVPPHTVVSNHQNLVTKTIQ